MFAQHSFNLLVFIPSPNNVGFELAFPGSGNIDDRIVSLSKELVFDDMESLRCNNGDATILLIVLGKTGLK